MTDTETEAAKDYIIRHTAHRDRQLNALQEALERHTGVRAIWDPLTQAWDFMHPTGRYLKPPQRNPAKLKVLPWFGNQNNKGKKWTAKRRELQKRLRLKNPQSDARRTPTSTIQ